jgi:hypothetical protein
MIAMKATMKVGVAGASVALAVVIAAMSASAQSFVEQGIEHRFQLDFHVNDAALKKMLPAGWEPLIATMGPAKDCNLRMIFIDRVDVLGQDGKPLNKGQTRLVYLAIPVKQISGSATGQMIISGLTQDAGDAPGAFGVYKLASTAKMSRSVDSSSGAVIVDETWDFAAPGAEHMAVHVKYERAPATKGGGEVKFYDPRDPSKYQIFKTEQVIDITRNVTTTPPDRVKEFSYSAGGGAIGTLFDGTEKVLSWDSFPWYSRTVLAP